MALRMRKNHSPKPPEPCALTECMAIIGGAWTTNIIWSLRAAPRRFSELESDIPPISAKVLTTRLKELTGRGLVERTELATSPPSVEYTLTGMGQRLIPAIETIVEVGHQLKTQTAAPEEL